jgi:hypothetical protein
MVDANPLSYAALTGVLLALTWKEGEVHPDKSILRPRMTLQLRWIHFLIWLRRLLLVSIPFKRPHGRSHLPLARRHEVCKHLCMERVKMLASKVTCTTWGLLAEPCAALALILPTPQELPTAYEERRIPLEV